MTKLIKIASNGQWSLEKNWKKPQVKAVDDWAVTGDRKHLAKLPEATGRLRSEMVTHLNKESNSRINPISKEKEYKAYRAANLDDDSHNKQVTSWTSSPHFAHYWTGMSEDPTKQKVMEAWIPEKHIHSYLPTIQEKHDHEKNEGEILVKPHLLNMERTLSGKDLEAEGKKYGAKPKKQYHYENGETRLTEEQSKAMHGQPHPEHPGRTWNHGTANHTGYVELPGYKYDIEGDDWVGRKNGKIVYKKPF